ncbi:hypothetical protein [Sphingomicrobium lutaoense]|uniref:Uncharacterized protein n=1 Tax=Sphingomicrobium lutaoense TaxID=515949 RepID=A0A839Z2X2_9SPHN|nr:hypothetical protein [Sphingomicrobium lutaoense]MBB3764417.1 hypothetical protein [Sphingomicrobium lutaoense]
MRKGAITASLATLVVLTAGPASADHQWGDYHWARDANPLLLTIHTAVGSQWDASVDHSIVEWNKSSVLNFIRGNDLSGQVRTKKCNPLAGEILVCSDTYGFRGWLGIATIWADGSHITQGTTQVNDSYFDTPSYNRSDWRNLVMCQELAHDIGLDHQDENFNNANLGTCMDYSNDPTGNEQPNAHDYEMLETMYAHLDTGGGDPPPPPCRGGWRKCGNDALTFREVGQDHPAGQEMGDWGRAIGHDGAGRPDTFVKELGNGRRKITHVFWARSYRPSMSR